MKMGFNSNVLFIAFLLFVASMAGARELQDQADESLQASPFPEANESLEDSPLGEADEAMEDSFPMAEIGAFRGFEIESNVIVADSRTDTPTVTKLENEIVLKRLATSFFRENEAKLDKKNP